jgi:hypothetical protein
MTSPLWRNWGTQSSGHEKFYHLNIMLCIPLTFNSHSFKIPVDFQQIPQYYTPKDRILHSLLCLLIQATWFSDKKNIYTKLNQMYRYSWYMPMIIHTQQHLICKDTALISSKSHFDLCPKFRPESKPWGHLTNMLFQAHILQKKLLFCILFSIQ